MLQQEKQMITVNEEISNINNIFEHGREYKQSSYISILVICVIILLVILVFYKLSNNVEHVKVPVLKSNKAEISNSMPEVEVLNISSRRKLLSVNDEIVIYTMPNQTVIKEEKKEVVKQREEPYKKAVVKKKEKVKHIKKTVVAKKETQAVKEVNKKELSVSENVVKTGSTAGALSQKDIKDVRENAAAFILAEMEANKKYPRQARRINAEGTAKIMFSVGKDGIVSSMVLSDSSGYKVLDNAALNTAKKVIGMNVTKNKTINQSMNIIVPVEYFLN